MRQHVGTSRITGSWANAMSAQASVRSSRIVRRSLWISGPRLVGRYVWSAGLFIVLFIAVQLLGPGARIGVYVSLGLWALVSPLGAVQALTLSWLTTYLNPALFEGSDLDLMLRWLVVGLAALRVGIELFGRRERGLSRSIAMLLAFSAVAAAVSIARSYALEVSLLRVVTFTVGAGTVLLCFQLAQSDRLHLERWFLALFTVLVLGGLPLIVHELGYVQNGRGFQGLMSHPQSYGTFLAPVAAWGTAVLATGRTSHPKLWTVLTIAAWVSLFASGTRTALLGAGGGLIAGAVLVLPGSVRERKRLRIRLLRPRTIVFTCVTLAGLTFFGTHLAGELRTFATKGQPDVSLVEVFERSRGELVAGSWANFKEQPVFGIGFGLASDPQDMVPRSVPGIPVPVAAPVEKGFLPTTVLEEVGLVGSAVFVVFLISIIHPLIESQNLGAAVLVMSALFVNLGEMMFFALGGMGLFMWLMVGYGHNARR